MDTIEGPKVEYSCTKTSSETQDFFSRKNLVQLYTISVMNPANIPRMIQYNKGTCLISLYQTVEEGNVLLTMLLDKNTPKNFQDRQWKRLRSIHGRLKTIDKLSKALEKMINEP